MTIAMQGTPALYENASSTTVVLTYPAGIQAGDLLLAHIGLSNVTAPTSPPAGWTLNIAQNGNNAISASQFYRIADGSETGTVTFTANATAGRVTGIMERWSGVDNTTPFDATSTGSGTAIATGYTAPTITTATNGAEVVYTIVLNASTSSDINTPAGLTKISGSTGTGRRTAAFNRNIATAGAVGTQAFTQTGGTQLQWTGIVSALKPGAGGTPGNVTAVTMTATATAIAPAVSGGGAASVSAVAMTGTATAYAPVITNGSATVTAVKATATATAIAPAVVGHTLPTLTQAIVGIAYPNTTTDALVQVKVANAVQVRLKCSTDSAGTTGVVYSGYVTPSVNGDAKLQATGLTAGTRYYYRIAMSDGTQDFLDTGTIGRLRTAPSGASSFAFDFGSCVNSTDSASMGAIATRADDLFFHLGDLYYADGSGSGVQNFRDKMNAKITATNHAAVFTQINTTYTPSDHDGMNNNVNAGNAATAWTSWNTARAELWPAPDTYYTFVWGRVRFIQWDTRSFASNPANTDNSSKTCLGTTQKQWFKDTLDAATEPLIVIAQDNPWIGSAVAGDDGWAGFTTERTELANYIAASKKNVAMIAGDMHAVGADNGTNAPGGITVWHGAPLNNNASQKGGPYSAGIYPASGTAVVDQYSRVVITDNVTSITTAFTGYSSDNTSRITLTETYATIAAPVMTATATAGTPVIGSSGTVAAVVATATATAIAPTVTGLLAPVVSAPAATATASAPAPTVVGLITGNVAAVAATATGTMIAPAVTAAGTANVQAIVAQATAQMIAPAIGGGWNTLPPAATATASAAPPVVVGAATVQSFVMGATASMPAPVVVGQIAANVQAVVMTATALAVAPAISGSGVANVAPPAATATGMMPAPVVVGIATANVNAVPMTATAQATAPAVTGAVLIIVGPMVATAQGFAPTVVGLITGNVTGVKATGTALALAPAVTAAVRITAPCMAATAALRAPALSGFTRDITLSVTALDTQYRVTPLGSRFVERIE